MSFETKSAQDKNERRGRLCREVILPCRKPPRSTVNGPPSSGKSIYYLKDARLASPGSDAASREASQVNRQRSSVLREEHILLERRKAGEDHARSQCPLRGEDLQSQSADAGQSLLRKGQYRLRRGQSLQAVARITGSTPNPFREASSSFAE